MENKIFHYLKNYYEILSLKRYPKFKELKEEKINECYKILESCQLCEWKCKVNRYENFGRCMIKNEMLISSYFSHYGEEFFFIPSFTIFFFSCNFGCVFCQNYGISHRLEIPLVIKPKELANIININAKECKNINLVGGEPTPQLPFILETLKNVKINKPIIWNSNFYFSMKAFNFIKDITDVYLPDFKYGNDECAFRLSKVKNYTKIIKRNLLLAKKDKKADIVIRHLVLPGHIDCCSKPIIDFIAKNLKEKAIINIMAQYMPYFKAYKFKEISKPLTKKEFDEVIDYAIQKEIFFIT
ncbi:MAG: radical SAM protein [Candidatus Pacearchaeota archaeon]